MTTNGNGEQQNDDAAATVGELGRILREARAARGLELVDVAELTHVRQDYLRALEEARFGDLPEDVYTRNFVRLYAQAVGVPSDEALGAYQAERQRAGGLSTLEMRLDQERRGEPPPAARRSRSRSGGGGRRPTIGPALLTFLLVVALVGGAVWVYNGVLFRTDRRPASDDPVSAAPLSRQGSTGDEASTPSGAPAPAGLAAPSDSTDSSGTAKTVVIDVISDPPGARVAIDGFMLPGVTPIRAAPVTARDNRLMRVTLDGYETWEESVDLSENRTLQMTLAAAGTTADSQPSTSASPQVRAGEVAIAVRATSWLEVYRGTARNAGERLVYTNAQAGDLFRFDLPVYIHAGNAAGVEVTVGDGPTVTLGSAGAVVGRAFTGQ